MDDLDESLIRRKDDFAVRDHDSVQIRYMTLDANEEGRPAMGRPFSPFDRCRRGASGPRLAVATQGVELLQVPWVALTSKAGFQEPDPDNIREFRTAIIDGRWKLHLFHLDGGVADRRGEKLTAAPQGDRPDRI